MEGGATVSEYRQFTEDDLKWIKRFKRVMKDAPSDLFMFVGGGITIYSERRMDGSNGKGVNDNPPSVHIYTSMDTEGGDW